MSKVSNRSTVHRFIIRGSVNYYILSLVRGALRDNESLYSTSRKEEESKEFFRVCSTASAKSLQSKAAVESGTRLAKS